MMYCDDDKCDFSCDDKAVPMYCPKCRRGTFSRPKGAGKRMRQLFPTVYYILTGPFLY